MDSINSIEIHDVTISQSPVFIVGCPRSGTTLLQALLSTQNIIYSFPETHFFSNTYKYIKYDQNANIDITCLDTVFEHIKNKMDLNISGYILDQIRRISKNKDLSTKYLFEIIIYICLRNQLAHNEICNIRWLEKTPGHFRHLDTIKKHYPMSKIIAIIREPASVINSRKKNIPQEKEKSVRELAFQWNSAITCFEEFKTKYPDDIYIIQYEKIVKNVEFAIQEIGRFLDITIQPEKLKNYHSEANNIILMGEYWKNSVKSKAIKNTNNPLNSTLSIIDKLYIHYITSKNKKKYGYAIKFNNLSGFLPFISKY